MILFIFLSEAGVHEIEHKWLGLNNIFYFSKIFPSRVFIFLSIFYSEGIKTFWIETFSGSAGSLFILYFSHTFTLPLSFISLGGGVSPCQVGPFQNRSNQAKPHHWTTSEQVRLVLVWMWSDLLCWPGLTCSDLFWHGLIWSELV